MKIFVATDSRVFFYNGKILANSKHSTILKRYYNAFGKIVLCARCCTIEEEQKGFVDISDIIDSVVEVGSLYEIFLNKHKKKDRSGYAGLSVGCWQMSWNSCIQSGRYCQKA